MLTRKSFITKDSNGCEFRVYATYFGKTINSRTLEWESPAEYRAMGIKTNSLDEIKRLVANK